MERRSENDVVRVVDAAYWNAFRVRKRKPESSVKQRFVYVYTYTGPFRRVTVGEHAIKTWFDDTVKGTSAAGESNEVGGGGMLDRSLRLYVIPSETPMTF